MSFYWLVRCFSGTELQIPYLDIDNFISVFYPEEGP